MAKKEEALAPVDEFAGMITTQRPEEGASDGPPSHIGREDVSMPRLALTQKTSKELEPSESRYIEGLKYTDLFHTGDKRVWGNGPVLFSILRADPPHHIEFRPMDEGGGIVDMDVPNNDPRTRFTVEDGKSLPPIATKFYDFIVLVLNGFDPTDPMTNVLALSLKSTGIKCAKALNNLITFRGKKELFRGVYKLTSGSDKNAKGGFAVYKVANAGWLAEQTPVFESAHDLWTVLKDQVITIEREPGDEEFIPANLATPSEM